MICTYCGAEIADNLKQCSECGMPTENLAVPVPADIKIKAKKKKALDDLDKIPPNKIGFASIIVAALSIAIAIFGGLLALGGLGLSHTTLVGFGAFVNITTIVFLAISIVASLVGAILSLTARNNKKCEQSTPLMGICFSILGFIMSACFLALFILYVMVLSSAK